MSKFAFSSFSDAMNMDGHGIYVWIVFALFFIALSTSFFIFNLLIKLTKMKKKLFLWILGNSD
jgi:heme exporter protein D